MAEDDKPRKPTAAEKQAARRFNPQSTNVPAPDTLDQQALMEDLGGAWGVGLIMSVPELMVLAYRSQGYTNARWNRKKKKIVLGQQDPNEEWDATRIALEIQNSNWYKKRDGSTRAAENARLSDPGTWQRNVSDIANSLTKQATEMGADLSGVDLQDLAERILKENYLYIDRSPDGRIPDSVIQKFLVPLVQVGKDGKMTGKAGMDAASIRATAKDYGIAVTDQYILKAVQGLADGTMSQQDILNYIVTQAKSAYTGMADKISETVSTKDLASTYIATMARTLEMDEDSVDLDTPEIKKALMFTDPSTGQTRQKSLWEFEQELRFDPRWENTRQGQAELSDNMMKFLGDMGFWKA